MTHDIKDNKIGYVKNSVYIYSLTFFLSIEPDNEDFKYDGSDWSESSEPA